MENKEVRKFANEYAMVHFPRYSFTIVNYFKKQPNINHELAVNHMIRNIYNAFEKYYNLTEALRYRNKRIYSLYYLIRDNFQNRKTKYLCQIFKFKVPSTEKEYSDLIYRLCMNFLNDDNYTAFVELLGKGKVMKK